MLNHNSVLTFTDPEASGLVYDFTAGQVLLATAFFTEPVSAIAEVALGTATVDAAGIVTAPSEGAEEPAESHSGASSIQWAQNSFHRPTPLPRPKVTVTSTKQKLLVDIDEEELIALGVL